VVMAGGGAACSRRSPVNLARAGLESARGGTAKAWGYFIGTTWCTSGCGPASARGCTNKHEPGVSATIEHVEPLLLLEF
jgi:hypothetical protein